MSMAIITGASAGLGWQYALALHRQHPEIDEYLLVARRRERLTELAGKLNGKRVDILALDLAQEADLTTLADFLAARRPQVRILINNAGYGWLGDMMEADWRAQAAITRVNVSALTAITCMVLPYLSRGSRVLNVSSIAAYVPTPRMTVYCSTKSYVYSFSKALYRELKPWGIGVTVACPGPMDTEFLDLALVPRGRSKLFDACPRVDPARFADCSLKKAFAGHMVYTMRPVYKIYRVLCKLLPHRWIMPHTTA